MTTHETTGAPLETPISTGTHAFDAGGETIGNVATYDAQEGWFTITSHLFPGDVRVPVTDIGDRGASGIYLAATRGELLQQEQATAGQGAAASTRPGQGSTPERDRTESAPAVVQVSGAGRARESAAETRTAQTEVSDAAELRVPVREEELVVGTRTTEAGRVHLRTEVVEERQTLTVPVTHEELRIERVAVDRELAAGADVFVEREMDVALMGEEVILDKRARVVEEFRLQKEVTTETEQVTDTVRKERVVVDGVDTQGHAITDAAQTTTGARPSGPAS